VIAAVQRGYFSGSGSNCAGPLNYIGVNPKIKCSVP
jgi:hypothetical protein